MPPRLRDLARSLRGAARRREARGLALLGLASVGSWTFFEVADQVAEGSTKPIDEAVLLAMRNRADPTDPLGPRWFEETARDFTALGGIGVLALIVGVACTYLLLAKKRRAAVFVFAAVAGGQLLTRRAAGSPFAFAGHLDHRLGSRPWLQSPRHQCP